jgi:hypothetical protein
MPRRCFGVLEFFFAAPVAALLDDGASFLELRSSRRKWSPNPIEIGTAKYAKRLH